MTDNNFINIDLIRMLYLESHGIKVINKYGDTRLVDDILSALTEFIDEHDGVLGDTEELEESLEIKENEIKEMIKHINKLERMLNSRNVNYKNWEEICC